MYQLQENDLLSNQFRLIKKIGKGHFSKVWEATDERGGKNVAIKVLKNKKKYEEMFEYELDALKIIKHNYTEKLPVIQFIKWFKHRGNTCIVFELVPYSLLDVIEKHEDGLPLETVKKITIQILEGMSFLNKHKIIHTDIKPENILINKEIGDDGLMTDEHLIKICDFNTIRFSNEVLNDADSIQTREYMSLEALINARYRENVDLWSIGCVSFELYTGDYLFDPHDVVDDSEDDESDDDNDDELIKEHLYQVQRLLGKIPKEVLERGKRTRKYFNRNGKLKGFDKINIKNLYDKLTVNYEKDPEESRQLQKILEPMFEYDRMKRVTIDGYLEKKIL